ncbi:MAG: hypothetical protein FVQ80_11095 [Planctomycetes bacterium]|nr:hypothetical protein [Planctomycetota bacterium]
MSSCCSIDGSNKIGGYDSYKVRNAADTCIEAKEIENGDQKFYKVALVEVQKKAKAAEEAARSKMEAADMMKLEKKTEKRMKKIYGEKK